MGLHHVWLTLLHGRIGSSSPASDGNCLCFLCIIKKGQLMALLGRRTIIFLERTKKTIAEVRLVLVPKHQRVGVTMVGCIFRTLLI